ncbi:MAG: UDP-N-acetylmuramate--L-alanine ligase, partial [Hasllibacter sp.]
MNAAAALLRPTRLPLDLGPIHFTGIGGIGMSGIAEVLLQQGFTVQGSDAKASANTERLERHGAKVFIGQRPENLDGAEVVVISTAIKAGNPELDEARRRGIPVVRRAEMLAELMRMKSNVAIAGTHGKTTTTTMVAALLDAGGLDPTVINGGIIHAYGSNARIGRGEWMVVEADESDGSFNRLPATIAIVTNIDAEHMDHWGTIEALRDGFDRFLGALPFYGLAVLCTDHPEVRALAGRTTDRRITTYGFNPQADIRAVNLDYEGGVARFDVKLGGLGTIEGCRLPMPGDHNVSNALSAVAVALHLGLSHDQIRDALALQIDRGTLAVGARLPSVRELARESGVSTMTATNAYQRLVADGCVEARPASGYYVAAHGDASGQAARRKPFVGRTAVDSLWLIRRV